MEFCPLGSFSWSHISFRQAVFGLTLEAIGYNSSNVDYFLFGDDGLGHF